MKHTRNGVRRGGRQVSAGSIYNILRNPIYVGEIQGDGETYPGEHEPIISRGTWDAAKALSASRVKPLPHRKQTSHFLAGQLWDDCGRHMLLSVAQWRGHRYFCYNSCNTYWSQRQRLRPYRVRADRLDQLVVHCVADFLGDRRRLGAALKGLGIFASDLEKLVILGSSAADRLTRMPAEALPAAFEALVHRVEVGQEHLSITFRSVELRRFLLWKGATIFRGRPADWACSDARYILDVAVCAISSERWPVVDIPARDPLSSAVPDPKLVGLIRTARQTQRRSDENRDSSLKELAQSFGCRPAHFARLIRLNFLAPDIVASILDGTQPPALTKDALLKAALPLDWALQRKLFGFPTLERKMALKRVWGQDVTSAVADRWA